jgi:hypothetical protein
VPQLPAVLPRLDKLQFFHANMLQLSFVGRRKTPSRKLSGVQKREGGDAEEEVAEDT